jgi:hypothetical protein
MILVSVFRDAESYLDRYINQVKALRQVTEVTVIVAEGDSTDDTYKRLQATDFAVLKVEHGGPAFGSVDHPVRWRQLAAVCNVAWVAAIRELDFGDGDQAVVWVEGDLIWTPETLMALEQRVQKWPAVAPMSFHHGRFYDIWGYRKNERRFGPFPPYHPDLDGDNMVTIDTAGSCIMFSPSAARVACFDPDDCILGLGRSLYAQGMSLWLDPTLKVEHQ